jgi:hypothetical protein
MAGENQRAHPELSGYKDFGMILMYPQGSERYMLHAIKGLEGVMG